MFFKKKRDGCIPKQRADALVKVNPAHQPPEMHALEEISAFYTSQVFKRARYNYGNFSSFKL